MVSIIVRTKNEERWITDVLNAIYSQDYKDFEVIIVDNKSTDNTIRKLDKYDVKILTIDKYSPGGAINIGIRESRGEYIACISAHCIPVNNQWLGNLLDNFKSSDIAGVYGRQVPMEFSSDFDKRDLLTVFGLDKRVQEKDSFFHNANSMIRRDLWEEYNFNEKLTNIEDREWAQYFIEKKYKIIYEPDASVYHYHGIHQNGNRERCASVVKVLENIKGTEEFGSKELRNIKEKEIACFIPVKEPSGMLKDKHLIEYTIEHALKSKYVKKIFVLTGDEENKRIAEGMGAIVPFLREEDDGENLEEFLKKSLETIESDFNYIPDMITIMWITFPFRKEGYIDELIEKLVASDFDSVIPVRSMHEICWQEEGRGKYVRIDSGHVPREKRKKVYVGVEGLGYVTYPDCIKNLEIYKKNVGIIEMTDPISGIKVRDPEDLALGEIVAGEMFFS